GDFDGDGRADLFLYRPGSESDWIWWGNGNRTFTKTEVDNIIGTFEIFVGDFDGDGRADLFLYRPGSESDWIWWGNGNRTFTKQASISIDGTFKPFTGDFNGDGRADVFWYTPAETSNPVTPELVNSRLTSGNAGAAMQSASFRMIGTIGEPALPNNATTLTSANFRHQPGFLAAAPSAGVAGSAAGNDSPAMQHRIFLPVVSQ
ncbi:MAG: hypothetical protein DCC55_31690, partial [Chloroflexi bacterium]